MKIVGCRHQAFNSYEILTEREGGNPLFFFRSLNLADLVGIWGSYFVFIALCRIFNLILFLIHY